MKSMSTRLLFVCAALGVSAGILFSISAYISGTIAAIVPVAYGLIVGIYFLPGVIAQALLRRPAVALVVAIFGGLVSAPFQPIGFMAVLSAGSIGLIQEIPFAVTRYKYWKAWLFYVTVMVAGALFGIGAFIAKGMEQAAFVAQIIYIACFMISPILFTGLGRLIAKQLEASGVARGLQPTSNVPHT